LAIDAYDDLWKWSVDQVPQFWLEAFHFLEIKSQNPPEKPEDVVDISLGMFPRPTWFGKTTLNFAENLLYPSPEIKNPDTQTAIIEASEAGVQQRVTWTELRNRVAQFATALRAAGITKGDRIGGAHCIVYGSNGRGSSEYVAFGGSISCGCFYRGVVVLYFP